MNQCYLILFLCCSSSLFAQDRTVTLYGRVRSDSTSIENVHIINKSSNEGTVSDQNGAFKIIVKLGDTLLFSDIQFYFLETSITEAIFIKKYVDVELLQKITTLNEVVLKTHNLFGNLTLDSGNFKDTLQEINPLALKYDGNYKALSNIVANKLNTSKMPDVTDPMAPIGGDILGLALFLFDPLIKEVSKIGKTKRELKKKEINYKKQAKASPDIIRDQMGEDFFINDLHISVNQIDSFILHCKSKGIIDLFLKNKKLEMINMMIKESKTF